MADQDKTLFGNGLLTSEQTVEVLTGLFKVLRGIGIVVKPGGDLPPAPPAPPPEGQPADESAQAAAQAGQGGIVVEVPGTEDDINQLSRRPDFVG